MAQDPQTFPGSSIDMGEAEFGSPAGWFTYILECSGGSYYTGVTTDLKTRVDRHNSGKGAKYTRARRPVVLVYFEPYLDEKNARRRERELKGWRRGKKERLVRGFPSERLADALRVSGLSASDESYRH